VRSTQCVGQVITRTAIRRQWTDMHIFNSQATLASHHISVRHAAVEVMSLALPEPPADLLRAPPAISRDRLFRQDCADGSVWLARLIFCRCQSPNWATCMRGGSAGWFPALPVGEPFNPCGQVNLCGLCASRRFVVVSPTVVFRSVRLACLKCTRSSTGQNGAKPDIPGQPGEAFRPKVFRG
jgi:hypothetical protein